MSSSSSSTLVGGRGGAHEMRRRTGGDAMSKKSDARIGGMVAVAVLVFLAVFTTLFVLMG